MQAAGTTASQQQVVEDRVLELAIAERPGIVGGADEVLARPVVEGEVAASATTG